MVGKELNEKLQFKDVAVALFALLCWAGAVPQARAQIRFRTAHITLADDSVECRVAGDMNNDGHTDLIEPGATPQGTTTVQVLLGNGDGTFRKGGSVRDNAGRGAAVIGDVNADRYADSIQVGPYQAIVYLGDGQGGLREASRFSTGQFCEDVVLGDWNRDGKTDVAVAATYLNKIFVLLGNGDGTFRSKTEYPAGYQPVSLAVADMNRDSRPDLVAATGGPDPSIAAANSHFAPNAWVGTAKPDPSRNVVLVFLGKGDGTFQTGVEYVVSLGSEYAAASVAVLDCNKDGKTDVAAVDQQTFAGSVAVFLGNGDGTVKPAVRYPCGIEPTKVAVADMDGDRRPDLLVMDHYGGNVVLLRGNKDGTFHPGTSWSVGAPPYNMIVADFDEDGVPDVLTANFFNQVHSRTLLRGRRDGTFVAAPHYSIPRAGSTASIADTNRDGVPDVVFPFVRLLPGNELAATIGTLLGTRNGGLKPAPFSPTGTVSGLVSADFSGDGNPDLIIYTGNVPQLRFRRGNGDGTFAEETPLQVKTDNPDSLASGDLNADGSPDLVAGNRSSGQITVVISNRDGTFKAGVNYPAGLTIASVVTGDFDNDNKTDVIALDYNRGHSILRFFHGNGDGAFATPASYPAGQSASGMAAGDLNRDRRLDLVVFNNEKITVLLGVGDGTFSTHKAYETGTYTNTIVIADFDGDNVPDLAAVHQDRGDVSVFRGNGDGSLQARQSFLVGASPMGLVAGDVDNDKKQDLVVVNSAVGLTVLQTAFPEERPAGARPPAKAP